MSEARPSPSKGPGRGLLSTVPRRNRSGARPAPSKEVQARPPPSHEVRGKASPVVQRPGQASPGCTARVQIAINRNRARHLKSKVASRAGQRSTHNCKNMAGGCSWGTGAGSGEPQDATLWAHRRLKIEIKPAVNLRFRNESLTVGADIEACRWRSERSSLSSRTCCILR